MTIPVSNNFAERTRHVTPFHTALIILLALLITACASHDGLYEPGCIAYEGDRIELQGGRFEWRRFTDQRVVGADGKLVEPFPDYPKTGSFRWAAGRLKLSGDDGMKLDDWFLVKQTGRSYLLSGTQYDAYVASDRVPKCALTLRDAER